MAQSRHRPQSPALSTDASPTTGNAPLDQNASGSPNEPAIDSAATRLSFPVVGIGSSAGGLEAFKKFFEALPGDTGMAYVLIPHLDPSHRSLMVELLSRETAMRVTEATDGMPLESDRVYIIPPNRSLTIRQGRLQLGTPTDRRSASTAIDGFFRSLAEDQQEQSIGIILSGTGSHGTAGLKEVKAAGGMVMAQDPASALYAQMPQSVVDAGLADYVLPPEQLPRALLEYARQPYLRSPPPVNLAETAAEQIAPVLELLRTRTRFDFRCYRKNMLVRRIQRRMGLAQIENLADYVVHLEQHPEEVTSLVGDLLIGVTSFFRDAEAFETLQSLLISELVERQSGETPVRIWVPACATGEEAYSIAILCFEEFARQKKPANFQIFASDIDDSSVEVARRGIYPASAVSELTPERLHSFFVKTSDDHYQVTKQLRASLVVTRQNVISDAPFSRLDLISCRNLLIYLEPSLQQKALTLFHFALRERGFLFLGCSESIGQQTDLFELVSKRWRMYRKLGAARQNLVQLPLVPQDQSPRRGDDTELRPRPRMGFTELLQKLLLTRYAPAAVLINRRYEVLSLFGRTSDYLELPTGELTRDLLSLMRQGLRTRIRASCHKVLNGPDPVTRLEARVSRGGRLTPCTVTVSLLREPKEADGLLLIAFQDRTDEPAERSVAPLASEEESVVVRQLEHEVESTRDDLQSSIEELQSSNEEVMSMNEELQSSNEELETSKEELQSYNEELSTVNSQLLAKIEEVERASNDFRNLLVSTDIATVFLDTDLRIRRFTPATVQLLNLLETDTGRSIRDFALRFTDRTLLQDAARVLDTLAPVETEIRSEQNRVYLRRILPYRTVEDHVDGVVLTFIDITDRKQIEQALADSERRLRGIVDTAADAIVMVDSRGLIESFNPAAERMFGYSSAELTGQSVGRLLAPPWSEDVTWFLARSTGSGRELLGRRRDGTLFPLELAVSELQDGDRRLFTGMIRDISERKRMQRELLTVASEEQRRIGQDLHDSVGQVLTGLGMLADSLVQSLEDHAPSDAPAATRIAAGLKSALTEIRGLARGLVPVDVDAEGLRAALTSLAATVTRDSGVLCEFDCPQPIRVEDNETATHLYRIAQEAITNALKHGAARQVRVSLVRQNSRVILTIRDDGRGIPQTAGQSPGTGLKAMHYRASLINATLRVSAPASGGTEVICELPENWNHGPTQPHNTSSDHSDPDRR